jgi:metal-responsive CopG/Arc/MetJ family transcriptional regulator
MSKVLISMPDELLDAIDTAVAHAGTTRSAFLQAAARAALGRPSHERTARALERGRHALASAGAFESSDLIRGSRDERDGADRHL